MSFEQLVHVTRIGHGSFPYFALVQEWQDKREHLLVYMQDLPTLVEDFKRADKKLYELNPRITLVDPIPRIRLSSACEAAVNCLYGMAEIAAQFGNKASKGLFPASFNALRKRIEKGDYPDQGMSRWLNDFQ